MPLGIEPPLSRLIKDIADLKEATLVEVDQGKEETTPRIKDDSDARNYIRDKLYSCVDPLDVPNAIIVSTLSPGTSVTQMSILKTLFRFGKPSCKNSSRPVSVWILPNDQ